MIYTIPDHILDELNLTAEEMHQRLTELLVEKRILTAEQAAEVVPAPLPNLPNQESKRRFGPPTQTILPSLTNKELANLSERNRLGIQLLEEYLQTPDDKGVEWWDEFDKMLYKERKKIKFRELEL